MNTPLSARRFFRAWSNLCLLHAGLVSGGLLFVWFIRGFTPFQTFAHFAEVPWFWALCTWPLWWPLALLGIGGGWRASRKTLLIGTGIWLLAALPMLGLMWSLRDYH